MDKIQRLEQVRKALNLSKFNFADLLGISPTNYSNVISGRTELQLQHIENLWQKKGINPFWVISGQGEIFLPGKGDSSAYLLPEAGLSIANDDSEKLHDVMKGVIEHLGFPLMRGDFAYAVLERMCKQYIHSDQGASLRSPDYSVLSASFVASLQTAYSFLGASLEMEGGKLLLNFDGQVYKFAHHSPIEQE